MMGPALCQVRGPQRQTRVSDRRSSKEMSPEVKAAEAKKWFVQNWHWWPSIHGRGAGLSRGLNSLLGISCTIQSSRLMVTETQEEEAPQLEPVAQMF